jgi:urease accessory protein
MMRAAFAAALLLLATAPAQAHIVIPGISGFPGGLLHPLLVPAHVLTLIALGLLAGVYGARTRMLLLAVFAFAAAAAFGLIAMAYSATQAETLVLCLGAAIGLLLAANLVPPAPAAALLTAAIADAVMFDSVPPVLTVSETTLALTGTAVAALALVAATAFVSGALPQRVRQIGIRIAGSWIAASAIMVLALRLSAVV